MKTEKNFVDFVIEAQNDPALAKDFADAADGPALKRVFLAYNFTAITDQECTSLAFAKSKVQPLVDAAVAVPAPAPRY